MAVWALAFSPLTAVRSVSVVGTDRTAAATVEAAASPQLGTPLLRWDAGAVQERLADAPYVSAVTLDRRWPDRIEVRVSERVPVAAVPRTGGGVDVVDARGDAITRASSAPDGLPTVAVDGRASRRGALDAATLTARSLPARLRAQVETVGATSGDDVTLTLRGGRPVRWGDRGLPESKAAVLLVLLEEVPDARGFDVSAPSAPATWTRDEPPAGSAGRDPRASGRVAAESDEGDSGGDTASRSDG